MKNRIKRRSFPIFRSHKFLGNDNKGIETEAIQETERRVYSMKERLTKDVRYQEFNEVTLDGRSD